MISTDECIVCGKFDILRHRVCKDCRIRRFTELPMERLCLIAKELGIQLVGLMTRLQLAEAIDHKLEATHAIGVILGRRLAYGQGLHRVHS